MNCITASTCRSRSTSPRCSRSRAKTCCVWRRAISRPTAGLWRPWDPRVAKPQSLDRPIGDQAGIRLLPSERVATGVVLAAAVATWIGFLRFTRLRLEDALITYRYAESLAQGRGFEFNPGEPLLGTTTPLQDRKSVV